MIHNLVLFPLYHLRCEGLSLGVVLEMLVMIAPNLLVSLLLWLVDLLAECSLLGKA